MGSTGSFNGMEESSWEEPGLFQGHSGWDVLEEGSGTSMRGIWAITCSDHPYIVGAWGRSLCPSREINKNEQLL